MSVYMNFVMNVRPRAETGAAHVGDNLPALDSLPRRNNDLRGVTVPRHDSVSVIYIDHVAVTAGVPTRILNNAVSRRDNRRAEIVCNVHARMKITSAPTQTIRRSNHARCRPN